MMITNFSSGELSPTLNGRTDIQQYFSGVNNLLNFNVIPTGGIKRRVGTQRLDILHGKGRLIPFIINEKISFIFEVIPDLLGSKIYVWNNDGTKRINKEGEQDVITAPWNNLVEINQIQYAQNYDALIMVQQNYAPFMIQYVLSEDVFKFGKMNFDVTPVVKLDDDYGVVEIVEGELPEKPTNNKVYVIYNNALYKWDGAKWVLSEDNNDYDIDYDLFNKEGKYPGTAAFFNGRLYLGATKEAQQKVWASAAPNLVGNRYNDFSTYIKYVTVNKVIKDPKVQFFTADATEGSDTLVNVTQDFTKYTAEELKKYFVSGPYLEEGTSCIRATWDAVEEKGTLQLTNPIKKSVTVQIFSIQLWRNRQEPSESDYEYKVANNNMTSPDNGFFFEIASDQNDAIKWLANASYLVIGTESGTYVMNPQANAVMQQIVMNGRYGTDALQATVVDNAVVYFGNGKRCIREYYWNQEQNGFRSNNLALLAPQMLEESPAVDFDFMSNPYSNIFITRADGTMVELLYDKNIGIQAWSRIVLGGNKRIESVAVTRCSLDAAGINTGNDKVFLAVEKDGNYYLELLDDIQKVYLDGWSVYTPEIDLSSYKGAILYNADTHEEIESIETIPKGAKVYIGYKYNSTVTSMPIVKQDTTAKKRITNLVTRFYNSYMPSLLVGQKKEIFDNIKEPYSGLTNIVYPGESQRDVTFTLSINKPEECNILAINASLD